MDPPKTAKGVGSVSNVCDFSHRRRLRDCYAADPMTDSHRPTDAAGPCYASLSQLSQESQLLQGPSFRNNGKPHAKRH
jgi:hypothetical protein